MESMFFYKRNIQRESVFVGRPFLATPIFKKFFPRHRISGALILDHCIEPMNEMERENLNFNR